jgi:hypothetical protein
MQYDWNKNEKEKTSKKRSLSRLQISPTVLQLDHIRSDFTVLRSRRLRIFVSNSGFLEIPEVVETNLSTALCAPIWGRGMGIISFR